MNLAELNYLPLPLPFFLIIVGIFLALAGSIVVGILRYAYTRLGISPLAAFLILLFSLIGSYVNIPVTQLPAEHVLSGREVVFFGMHYVIPVVVHWPGTVIAINLGGAAVPVALSGYLLARHGVWLLGAIAVAFVTFVCHSLAYPVAGLGIAVPVFVPPAATAVIALLLSRRHAAVLAYVGGSLGTLIGADLMNLDKIAGLGAPVASIGGAGTFDGIFLTGLVAVFLASVPGWLDQATSPHERAGR